MRRLENLLDLQSINPGTHGVSTGTMTLTRRDPKGASNISVLLDSDGPGTLRTHLELGTTSWRQIWENIFDHLHNNISNLLTAASTTQLHPIYTAFVHRKNLMFAFFFQNHNSFHIYKCYLRFSWSSFPQRCYNDFHYKCIKNTFESSFVSIRTNTILHVSIRRNGMLFTVDGLNFIVVFTLI